MVTLLGWLSDLLERLSDLQLGDEKVTLKHLAKVVSTHLWNTPQKNLYQQAILAGIPFIIG